jgi:hypothetical protein
MVATKFITFLTVAKYLFQFFVGFFPFNLSDVLSTIVCRFVIVIFVFRVTGSDYPPFVFYGLCFMMFNVTFNNISAASWWSVLLVEETGVPGENYRIKAKT